MTPFDCKSSLETHGVFLDISKAFDRVWHDGLIFKLKQNGVSGNLFQLIKSFPSGRFSRVLFNGQTSEWVIIQAALSQDLILGAIFFLIYILMTQQANKLNSNVKPFAVDTSLFLEIGDPLETAN